MVTVLFKMLGKIFIPSISHALLHLTALGEIPAAGEQLPEEARANTRRPQALQSLSSHPTTSDTR